MSTNVDGQNLIRNNDLLEASNGENLLGVIAEQNDSELRWVQLHQLFDR